MKFVAVGCLFMLIGFIAGFFVTPYVAPIEPTVVNGEPQLICGLPVLASMFFGGIVGGAIGLPVGLVVAWLLPTPRPTTPK